MCTGDNHYQFPEPDAVADAVLHALFSRHPEERYLAVTDQRHAEAMIRDVLRNLVEVNGNGHSFGFSRDELVMMLDEAFSGSEGD